MLGLAATVFGYTFAHGVNVYAAMLIALAVGATGGAGSVQQALRMLDRS